MLHPWMDIVSLALREDLAQGDVTSDNLPGLQKLPVRASLAPRVACVLSGCDVATAVLNAVDDALAIEWQKQDGDSCQPGEVLATISGPAAALLRAERTLLNFMQHLSGVATTTRLFAELLAHTHTRITHTRKTTPGMRLLEQQAVVHGGGAPHRYNLGSAVMIKDNHWLGLNGAKNKASNKTIAEAVAHLRKTISHTTRIEVEVDHPDQIEAVLAAGVDIILLDNMTPAQVKEAVEQINGRFIVEVSGNITLQTVAEFAMPGVAVISTSKLTLGAPAIDIGLDFLSA